MLDLSSEFYTSDIDDETISARKSRRRGTTRSPAAPKDRETTPRSMPSAADSGQTSFAAQELSDDELAELRRLLS